MKKLLRALFPIALLFLLICIWYKTADLKTIENDEDPTVDVSTSVSLATIGQPDKSSDIPFPSDNVTIEENVELPLSIPEEAFAVEVLWVSDGDTYIVDLEGTETTIRLIGVDTPESVAPEEYLEKSGKKNTEEGKLASNAMKEKLPAGTEIYIVIGEQPIDDYGRTLAYAWFSDGQMIEEFLLSNGYAKALTIEPNTRYAEYFIQIEQEAKETSI